MMNPSQTQRLVGLNKELRGLVARIQNLCERKVGSSVFISAPHSRGKTALWQKAIEEAKAQGSKPTAMAIDLTEPPQGATEMLAMLQRPGFLSEKATKAAISLIKLLADGAGQVPMDWVFKLILKMVGALPDLVQQIEEALQQDKKSPCDFSFALLRRVVTAAARQPLVLILENVESASSVSVESAVKEIVDLVRHGQPIMLVVTFDASRLSGESKLLLEKRSEVGDAALWKLPSATEADLRDVTGPVTSCVLNDLRELAGENVDVFLELWTECQQLGLVCQNATGEWTWDSEAETEFLGKFAEGAFQTLKRVVEKTVEKIGDEKLVRLTLGIGSLQLSEFSDEVVANVLWRLGLRRADHYTGEDGHLDRVIDLLDEQFNEIVEDAGFDAEERPRHRFSSALLRHFVRGDIPAESRQQLFAVTASALEQVYRGEQGYVAWLVIDLYRLAGQKSKADRFQDHFITSRSPVAQVWELARLSESIRALRSDVAWAAWVVDVSERLEYIPEVRNQVLQLVDEAITAMLAIGETEVRGRLLLLKARLFLHWGWYPESLDFADQALKVIAENAPSAGECHGIQGNAYRNLGRFDEAVASLRRALAAEERNFGPNHPRVGGILNDLALLLVEANQLVEAEPLLLRALDIAEKTGGADDPCVAIRLHNLALLLHYAGRPADAEPLLRRALAIDEKARGPDDPEVAKRLGILAFSLQGTNRLEEAEPLLRRALAIEEKALGPDHPEVAKTLNNLAIKLQGANRLDQAEPLMRRAVVILRKSADSHGQQLPFMQGIVKNYIELLMEMGLSAGEIERRVTAAAGIYAADNH